MHKTSHASRLTRLLSQAFLFGTLSAAVAGAESPADPSTSGPTVLGINGRQQQTSDGQPRRSFDLSTHRLFDQLDHEELRFVRQATEALTDLSIPKPKVGRKD